jgi:hypothetical protein
MTTMLQEQASLIQKQIESLKHFADTNPTPAASTDTSAAVEEDGKKKKKKQEVDPNRPKRPMNGYQLFMTENNPDFREKNPSLDMKELMTVIGAAWAGLPSSLKAGYLARAVGLRDAYLAEMEAYFAANPDMLRPGDKAAMVKRDKEASKASTSTGTPAAKASKGPAPAPAPASPTPAPAASETDKKKKKKRKSEAVEPEAPAPTPAAAVADTEASDKKKKVSAGNRAVARYPFVTYAVRCTPYSADRTPVYRPIYAFMLLIPESPLVITATFRSPFALQKKHKKDKE